MKVKGTAVKPTLEFIKNRFPDRYDLWFNKLPEESKKIYKDRINAALWYSAQDALLIPTKIAADMFYKDELDAAFEMGKYSAEMGLKGVYKIFIRIATPKFILSRATNIFSSYFNPSVVKLDILKVNHINFNIYKFTKEEKILIYRIAGWIQKAMELTNCKNVVTTVEEHKENEELKYKIVSHWD